MASTNRGTTAYVGIVQKQVTSATNLSTPDSANGNYSLSSVHPVVADGDRGSTASNAEESAGLPTAGAPSVYKMTGWYAGGSAYETWTSLGAPNLTPPSGHTLTFLTYLLLSGGAAN